MKIPNNCSYVSSKSSLIICNEGNLLNDLDIIICHNIQTLQESSLVKLNCEEISTY